MTWNSWRICGLAAAVVVFTTSSSALALEVITFRSGQFAGSPGVLFDPDDIVNYYTEFQGGAPLSTVFDTEFAAADAGASAIVINPHPFWTPNLPADPLARWINPETQGGFGGLPMSTLYSVPFTVTTPGTSNARLDVYVAVDDGLGDTTFGGPNPEGMYLNGVPLAGSSVGANFGAQTLYEFDVTVNNGLNYLYFYQRDQGFAVSGLIFSATVTIPEPSTALLTLSPVAFALLRRRRR